MRPERFFMTKFARQPPPNCGFYDEGRFSECKDVSCLCIIENLKASKLRGLDGAKFGACDGCEAGKACTDEHG